MKTYKLLNIRPIKSKGTGEGDMRPGEGGYINKINKN
jgi:hypothetical protein